MKKGKKNKKIIIYLIFFIGALSLIYYSLNIKKTNFIFEQVIKDFFYNSFSFNKKECNLSIDNQMILTYNNNLKRENNELKSLLELKSEEIRFISSKVINRDISFWYNNFTINKGKKDGVDLDMIVINEKGLIGIISSITNNTSTVKLISNSNLVDKISVRIENENDGVYGLLSRYNNLNNTFVIEGISENEEIKKGSNVFTSGLSEIYPGGILIGTVENIKTDQFDLAMIIEVKPSVDFGNINYVGIIERIKK